jgi:hypothetical protein
VTAYMLASDFAGTEPPADATGQLLCERSLNWDGEPPICGEPALFRVRSMCVHEHLGEANVCAACLAEERRFCDDSEWECEACASGPDAHDCPMPQTVTELENPDA